MKLAEFQGFCNLATGPAEPEPYIEEPDKTGIESLNQQASVARRNLIDVRFLDVSHHQVSNWWYWQSEVRRGTRTSYLKLNSKNKLEKENKK